MYDTPISLVLGAVFASLTAMYTAHKYQYNNLLSASLLFLMSALILTIVPPPGILIPLPHGYLILSLPLILEVIGVSLLTIALTQALGLRKTFALITVVYVLAIVVDAIIYYDGISERTLLPSIIVNTIVYAPSIISAILVARRY